jgi:cytochrome c-type biogenesis protein CcmH
VRALAAVASAFLLASPALASNSHPTLAELETEVICPVCPGETLDQADSALAQRMKQFIARRIAAGDTKGEIKGKLVAQFGPAVLASPPKKGFDLIVWVLPFVGVVASAVVVALLARRWARTRGDADPEPVPSQDGRAPLDPELEQRLEEELAGFDS